MKKVNELLREMEGQYSNWEVYKYNSDNKTIHTDYISYINDEEYNVLSANVIDYQLMNEEEYNGTINANSSIKEDFGVTYDDKNAKVLIIIIDDNEE